MQTDLISVLIRTIGRPELEQAINSVLNQTYKNFEILVFEDGGIKAQNLCEKYKEVKYYHSEQNVGRSKAGNELMQNASGKYCIFLDDDDEFLPNHLENLIKIANNNIAYSLAYEIGIDYKNKIKSRPYILQEPKPKEYIYQNNFLPINTVLFPKEAFLKYGGFDEDLDALEDWLLWAKYLQHYNLFFTNSTSALYYVPYNIYKYLKRHKYIRSFYHDVVYRIQKLNNLHFINKLSVMAKIIRKFKVLLIILLSRLDRRASN